MGAHFASFHPVSLATVVRKIAPSVGVGDCSDLTFRRNFFGNSTNPDNEDTELVFTASRMYPLYVTDLTEVDDGKG